MTESSKPSTANDGSQLWNESQRHAMAALELPMWQTSSELTDTASSSASDAAFYYKLESWLLVSSTPLPEPLSPWQQDILRSLAPEQPARPTEVSATVAAEATSTMMQLDLDDIFKEHPSAEAKRALWSRLCMSND
ncbi:hypothetical protein PSI9734_02342 [Pseudidiomarina piscicola]|uniref:Uncharacterized protein n=1 Tax=Pseudidiomarina piscicola TaxID=2614830 RepID=A0A6S6WQD2_9GAMM|nr:hypothetical protein [Pseudidiomarina piscicola]CAB0151994.1 hypothetical protein PSI9734_02342 [Pseudidiomarina piscicola]VZT41432.1 hypothetical protein PSI9734_02342 [Pseudomonas aeruginosa]